MTVSYKNPFLSQPTEYHYEVAEKECCSKGI